MMATTNRTVPTMHWKQQLSALTQNLISSSYKPCDVDAGLQSLLWEKYFRIPGFSGFRKLILNMKHMLCTTIGSLGKHSGTQWNVCTRGKWVLEVPVNQLVLVLPANWFRTGIPILQWNTLQLYCTFEWRICELSSIFPHTTTDFH